MNVTTHTLVFAKETQRHRQPTPNSIEHILGTIGKSMAANGWSISLAPEPYFTEKEYADPKSECGVSYHNELRFTVQHTGDTASTKTELRAIAKLANTRSTNPLGGRWTLASVDGDAYEITRDGDAVSIKDFIAYADFDIPADFESPFDHLYGLESHIAGVKRSCVVARNSQFSKRYHVALIGPPGCGKSDICETLADMLGEDVVMKFDATATTAAGAIKQLDEAEILPRILVVEEIEKVNAEALTFLLSLMDLRGEIRKTTARSKIVKDTKILVVATVNNHTLFDSMLAGALSSRFSRKLWFHRPSEDVLRRILAREIADMDGDEAWIEPVIEYAREKNITDPRMLSALALCGGDGWLDGTFYKELADTDKPQDY